MKASKALVANLKKASESLKRLGSHRDMMSHYESATDLANFIEAQSALLASGSISKEDFDELWYIFAPASEWDDYGGDVNLGESIFSDLEVIKKEWP